MTAPQDPPIYTIGHSTHSIGEFVDLLRRGGVEVVVDVRSIPRSRTNPSYNVDRLGGELAPHQIGHLHLPALGGLRSASKTISPQVNAFWRVKSFHNYADHALSGEFREGFARLATLARERRCAIMCAEAVWWRCHRRIIADYLLHEGREVLHLMPDGRVEVARLTPAAAPAGGGLHYPPIAP